MSFSLTFIYQLLCSPTYRRTLVYYALYGVNKERFMKIFTPATIFTACLKKSKRGPFVDKMVLTAIRLDFLR